MTGGFCEVCSCDGGDVSRVPECYTVEICRPCLERLQFKAVGLEQCEQDLHRERESVDELSRAVQDMGRERDYLKAQLAIVRAELRAIRR